MLYNNCYIKYIIIIMAVMNVITAISAEHNSAKIDNIVREAQTAIKANDYNQAIDYYTKLGNIYKTTPGNHEKMAELMMQGGNVCYDAYRYIEALDFYTLTLTAARKAGNKKLYGKCLMYIGDIYGVFEDYERAESYFKKSLAMGQKIKDYDIISKSIVSIVIAASCQGNTDEAKKYFIQQTKFPISDSNTNKCYLSYNQAMIAYSEKDWSAALFYFNKTLEFVQLYEMGKDFEFTIRNDIGRCYMKSGNTDKAIKEFETYLKDADSLERTDFIINANLQLYEIYKKRGDKEKAKEYFTRYNMILDSLYNHNKMKKATNSLLEYEELTNTETITDLNNKVNTQLIIIIVIILVMAVLTTMVVIIVKQKRNLENSYKLLINKENVLNKQTKESTLLRNKYLKIMKYLINAQNDGANIMLENPSDNGMMNDCNVDQNAKGESVYNTKQEGQIISQDQKEELINKILAVMENKEFVFNPNFSLTILSREVGSNIKYVSFVINDTYNTNFKTFLNGYRLREACRLLKETDHQIQWIAAKVGYNSPNSFIKIFKKALGMTPAVYKKLAK